MSSQPWSKICNESFSKGPRLNYRYGMYGQGNGPIHMTNLYCTGAEESVFDCTYDGADSHVGCEYYGDASVECAGKCLDNIQLIFIASKLFTPYL